MNNIHVTTRDLPEGERPYEKCKSMGANALSDAELLAVILRTGCKDLSSVQLGQLLLSGRQNNLLNLYDYSIKDLVAFPGIGEVKAIELLCVAELAKRITSLSRRQSVVLRDSKSVASYFMERLRHFRQEHVILAMFDAKGMLIRDIELSKGSATCSIISARDIFTNAIRYEAVYIIVLHNHPSGDPRPSSADDDFTAMLRDAGTVMDIPLRDHIIIGDNNYYSYTDSDRL